MLKTGAESCSKMYQPSETTKIKIYEQFGRNKEMVEDDVNIIKEWFKTQPHLPEIMEDLKIKNFLNLNKFSIEKTKQKIDMYYTIRSLLPDFFVKSNPKLESMKQLFDDYYMSYLPKPLDDIHRVYYVRQKRPNCFQPIEYINTWYALFEIRIHEDFMVNDVIVYDFANLNFADFKKITPTVLANFLGIYQKVYSLRIKNIFYINCPSFLPMIVQLLKSAMKPKIFERVHFYPDHESLKQVLPIDYIPKDYGGTALSLDELNEIIKGKLVEYQDRFDQLDKLIVNEELRPEKLDNDEVLGYYGSFKKISVD